MEIYKYVPFLQHINENGTPKIEGTRLNGKNQVPKSDQPKLDDFVRDQMSGREMQEYNKKFCRFGPYEPLARDLRYNHTRAAIKHHELKLYHTIMEMNIDTLGPRFLPRITNIHNEKKSGWYHQSKNNKNNNIFKRLLFFN